tara:strand:- start:1095 stop:2591 length:1497 start_codon:yes stop_codon:yes gene_type:complete
MQYLDIMIGSMIMNNLNNFKTNIIWLDLFLFSFFMIFIFLSKDNKLNSAFKEILYALLLPEKKENQITFMFKRGEQSNRCKALFHYLTVTNYENTNVKKLIEDIFKKYDRQSDMYKEYLNVYRVDQVESFTFCKNIKGRIYIEEKDSGESHNGKTTLKEYIHLEVFSETESLSNIKNFIEECKTDFNNHLKNQLLENQYIITIESFEEINKLKPNESLRIQREEWSSNVTFNSRFFPEKEETLKIINHFVNNKEWFKRKGLNHTLGILLSGEPGCGKTSFIKALMNYTKRHTIEIKLNDNFDFSDLKDIIFDEEIDEDLIIPQDKRIIVFEDIDAMGNIVKDRNLKRLENNDASDKLTNEIIKCMSNNNLENIKNKDNVSKIKNKINKKENNNLSYLLNILDGINETPGRIIIMTTNKPEILDEALIRPGRIDIKINFTKSTEKCLKEILNNYWEEDDEEEINKLDLSELDKKYTPAEIIDFCRKNKTLNSTIETLKL